MEMNNLKKTGLIIKYDNAPYQVLDFSHARTAQRKATVWTKLKNIITGQVLEKTFNSGDNIEEAEIDKQKVSYLYRAGNDFFFLNSQTFEQFSLDKNLIKDASNFLKEGLEINILYYDEKPLSIELPKKVDLKITSAPPAVKGNSANTPTKQVIVETGYTLTAPIFTKEGDIIRINTETGEYVERVLS